MDHEEIKSPLNHEDLRRSLLTARRRIQETIIALDMVRVNAPEPEVREDLWNQINGLIQIGDAIYEQISVGHPYGPSQEQITETQC